MRTRPNLQIGTPIVALVVLCAGCGTQSTDLAEVRGRITLDGRPLPNAWVRFLPEKGRASEGRTNDLGEFTLEYTRDKSGALIGVHEVRIGTATTTGVPATDERIPPQYNERSSLTVEVQPGINEIDFPLSSSG